MLQRSTEILIRPPAAMETAPSHTAHDSEIDILAVLRLLRRRVRAVVLITATGTALIAAAAMLMTPRYSAIAVLRIDPGAQSPVADTQSDPMLRSSQAVDAVVESDVEMLGSPGLMRRIVERLDLGSDPEFTETDSPVEHAKEWVRNLLKPSDGSTAENPTAAAAGALGDSVEARRIGLTYLVEFEAWSRDPQKAARIANTAIHQFLESQLDAKRQNVASVNALLSEHISELRERLQASEQAVQRYMTEERLFDHDGEKLNDRQMPSPNRQPSRETAEELQSAATSRRILDSEIIANLRRQHAELSQQFAEVSTRYGPNHPSVVRARTELANVSEQIARLSQKTLRLNELQREADANRELYQGVLQRAKLTAAARELQMPGAYVVTKAAVPTFPSAPKRAVIVVVGFATILALAIAYAIAREVMVSGIRGAEDLRQSFGLSPIASVPRVGTARRRAIESMNGDRRSVQLSANLWAEVLDHPESAFSESIRSLRFSLNRYAELGREMRVLMISSVLKGEGKSTVAVNLAREAAAAGERVLLIDADLRRPSLAAALGLRGDRGLARLLSGSGDQRYLIQLEPRAGVRVIAGSESMPGAQALRLLSSEGMNELLWAARRNFDLVVIDTAPLGPITDPRALIERVDGVVMVVSDRTSRETIAAALHETPGLNERLVGIVLNRMLDSIEHYYPYGSGDNSRPASA
jgi:succinoglycan biosynthesis transport protein ExoP